MAPTGNALYIMSPWLLADTLAQHGQLFAVVVMGGAATPKGVFAALTPRAGALANGQATGRAPAVGCAGSGRAPGYRAGA
eukprot:scaffold6581_cov149-Isochrysis_galbana.AAC.1